MPEMDGLELVRHVRGPLGLSELPSIIVTTKGEEMARGAARRAGANADLTKPLSGVQLVDLVERLAAAPSGAGAGREG